MGKMRTTLTTTMPTTWAAGPLPPLAESWRAGPARSSLALTTCEWRWEIEALVDSVMATKAKQEAAGRASAQKREDKMYAKIMRAAGALRPEFRGFVAALTRQIKADMRRPQPVYGFKAVPDRATLTKAQDRWLHEKRTTLVSSTLCST